MTNTGDAMEKDYPSKEAIDLIESIVDPEDTEPLDSKVKQIVDIFHIEMKALIEAEKRAAVAEFVDEVELEMGVVAGRYGEMLTIPVGNWNELKAKLTGEEKETHEQL